MQVISIDPGLNTGVVILEDQTDEVEILFRTTIDAVMDGGIDATWTVLKMDHPDAHVIVEKGPTQQRQNAGFMEKLDQTIRHAWQDATWVEPGEWKNTRFGKMQNNLLRTPHEKDAYCMGMWHLDRLKKGKA